MTSSFQLLKQAFKLIGENPSLFLKIVSLTAILSIVINFLVPTQDTAIINLTEWTVFMALILVMIAVNILMAIALVFAVADRTLTFKQTYQMAIKRFWRYLGCSIIFGLITSIPLIALIVMTYTTQHVSIVFLSVVLLIIPSILVSVWFAFATYFLVLENLSIKQSLKASHELVKGRWWSVAWRLLALIAFTIIISTGFGFLINLFSLFNPESGLPFILSTILNHILTPVAVAYMFLLYFNLKSASFNSVNTEVPSYQ